MPLAVTSLPLINAVLNAASALLLITGYSFIKRRRIAEHRRCMLSAFGASSLFLAGYLTLRYLAGMTHFTGQGWIRPVYFTILISHTILAAAIVPLVLRTLYLGLKRRDPQHKRLARWTLPLWLYVSVTGVVIYLMLYRLYPAGPVRIR